MNIQLNKRVTQILSVLIIGINLFGLSAALLVDAKLNNISLTNIDIIKLVTYNLVFFFSSFSKIILGIWLYFNVKKLNQDKWTWLFIGLVCGQYSLILLLMTVLLQKIDMKQDLFKLIQNSLLILICAIAIDFVVRALSGYSARLITNFELLHKLNTTYLWVLPAVNVINVVILNILFTLKINKILNENKIEKKLLWIISTLISGIFAVILLYNLIAIKNEREQLD
jgi:hypothetical protein